MIGRQLVTMLTAAVLSFPVPLLAQGLEPGQRIRVTAPDVLAERQVGQLLWLDVDSLVLESASAAVPQRWVIPPESITQLEASQGRRGHAGKGFLIGAGVGLVGGLIGISGQGTCTGSGNYGEFCAIIVTGSTITGGLLGLLIGAATRSERWVSIPVG